MRGRQSPSQLVFRGSVALAVSCIIAVTVAGCITSQQQQQQQEAGPNGDALTSWARGVDLSARTPQAQPLDATNASDPSPSVYYGDERPVPARPQPGQNANTNPGDGPATVGSIDGAQANGQGYDLNFENTPISTVAKVVFGDILGVGYTIDPRVQATVSLSSGRPVPKNDILHVIESALRVSNVALVREARGYRLVPTPDAVGTGGVSDAQAREAGYGISVFPLQHVSAQTISKFLENFAARPGMVRADRARNLIVVQGNSADRRALIDAVLSFDADWMRGQSVGIYPISNSTPEPVIAELERIIDSGEGGMSQDVVKLQPIARQNAILVVASKAQLLKTAATWITRLDRVGGAGIGVKVYRMRYGDARQVAALLNDIFGNGSDNGGDSSLNQLAPGSGAVASSSTRPNPNMPQQGAPSARAAAIPQQTAAPAPDSFDARFADAAGGRSVRGVATPTSGSAARPVGGPGPALQNVRIAPDVVNNTLLIYASQEHYRIIERTLQQIDRPQLQVAIDATIAEVTLNDTLRYGVQFFLKSSDVGLGKNEGSVLNTTNLASAALSRVLPGFNFLVGTEARPRLIIDALQSVTDVKVLSTPSVVVIDNQFATLQVGDQIPITTRTAQSVDTAVAPVVNNIDYRNTGVILRVMPRINANGNVLLDVEQEISNVADTATAETLTPTVSQRKVKSSIAVASGQTVLLGGLISERHDRVRGGIPGLIQIPGLGDLFSHNKGIAKRTELIIFIRPQIIRHGIDARRIAEELRAKMVSMGPTQKVQPRPQRCRGPC